MCGLDSIATQPFYILLAPPKEKVGIELLGMPNLQTLMYSSFLVMICVLIRDFKILPKKELHKSLQE